jgi:signal transduction histidine kinase/CheY-like chemotaxis protein
MAVLVVAASFLLRHFIVHGLGQDLPIFLTFYPAVILVAILAGFGPGLLATALVVLGTDYFLLPPFGHLVVARSADAFALVFFAIMGALISLLAERYRRGQLSIAAHKVEEAVRRSEVLYRGLFSSMDEGFCIIQMLFDKEGKPADYRFLETNAAFDRQTGLHEAAGKRMRELAPSIEEYWFETYGKVALTGEPVHFFNESKALGRHFEASAYRVGEPELRQVAVVFSDITARVRADRHIQQLNRVYSVLSDINQTIVREKHSQKILEAACTIAVEKGHFRMAWVGMVNPVSHVLEPVATGGVVDGYLDSVLIDFSAPEFATESGAQFLLSGKHAVCNDIEHQLRQPWTTEALRRGYRSSAALLLRSEGKLVGVMGLYAAETGFFDADEMKLLDEMAMDISYALEVNRHDEERRQAEDGLRWRTAFFEAQVESSLDGVLVIDSQGRKILQNRRVNELFKIPRHIYESQDDDVHRQYVATIIKDPVKFETEIQYLNSHPEQVSRDEIELIDGTILDRFSAPVRDKQNNYYGRIWTFRDITEQRQLESNFRQAQKMEAVGQLTGGIAHDFNNLLTVILGCSEVIGEEVKADPRLGKMAEMVLSAARRGAELTHRMLAFARRQTLEPRAVNVNHLLMDMEAFLRRTLSADVDLDVIQGCVDCEAMVDPTELESAILNLCVNARDAMPGGGTLTIETGNAVLDESYALQNPEAVPGEYLLVAVSDTGTGISPENLGRVFDPFFTTKEVGKGTGLGLSMVYGFVKQSRGHIKIYSEPGHGTSVKLYLPRTDQKTEPSKPVSAPVGDHCGSEVILLVEDNAHVREFAKTQLEHLGYRVIASGNGTDALQELRNEARIDLLFTDVVMPGGMNGPELAREACKLAPRLKVLFTSGYAENAIAHHGLLDKDVQLLNKPYTRLELAGRIRNVLDAG